MKASGCPSARSKARWRTAGASMWLSARRRVKCSAMRVSGKKKKQSVRPAERVVGTRPAIIMGLGCSDPFRTGGLNQSIPNPTVQPMSPTPALVVENLRKTYSNGVQALKGINLTVQPGDFFALLGPNGAGKSTLIGILSSLVNASGGDAAVF